MDSLCTDSFFMCVSTWISCAQTHCFCVFPRGFPVHILTISVRFHVDSLYTDSLFMCVSTWIPCTQTRYFCAFPVHRLSTSTLIDSINVVTLTAGKSCYGPYDEFNIYTNEIYLWVCFILSLVDIRRCQLMFLLYSILCAIVCFFAFVLVCVYVWVCVCLCVSVNSQSSINNPLPHKLSSTAGVGAPQWQYGTNWPILCRRAIKHQLINQSINQSIKLLCTSIGFSPIWSTSRCPSRHSFTYIKLTCLRYFNLSFS